MATVLIYGFKPFAEYRENISEKIIRNIKAGGTVKTHVFDVIFNSGMFNKVFEEIKPGLIIGLGQHSRARKLRLEKKAVNEMREPGRECSVIAKDGPEIHRVTYHLPETGLTTITYDAGDYVCNYSMYLAAEYCHRHESCFAFIHVPRKININTTSNYLKKVSEKYSLCS